MLAACPASPGTRKALDSWFPVDRYLSKSVLIICLVAMHGNTSYLHYSMVRQCSAYHPTLGGGRIHHSLLYVSWQCMVTPFIYMLAWSGNAQLTILPFVGGEILAVPPAVRHGAEAIRPLCARTQARQCRKGRRGAKWRRVDFGKCESTCLEPLVLTRHASIRANGVAVQASEVKLLEAPAA